MGDLSMTKAAEGKAMLTPRHSLNASSEPRSDTMFKRVESKFHFAFQFQRLTSTEF